MIEKQITLGEAREAWQALGQLSGMALPPQVSFRIAQVINQLKSVVDDSNIQVQRMLENKATESEEVPGQWNFIDDETRSEFLEEVGNLMAEPVIVRISLISIADVGSKEISPAVLAACMWMFDEEG